MKKKRQPVGKVVNRRAKFDYELGDSYIVGMQLTGAETKALRLGHGQLQGAYVMVKDDELWLINSRIIGRQGLPISEQDQTRSRKLLAKRREIENLMDAKKQGRTIVPLELLIRGRYIKLKIAIGKGKKGYDKREALRKRQQDRDIARHASTQN